MSTESFQIVYDGPALENSSMDVRDLSPALLALGRVIEEANQTFNHGATKVTIKVKASFKTGCFGIEFDVVQGLLDQAVALFRDSRIATAHEIVGYLGFVGGGAAGLIKFLRWLRNRAVTEVVILDDKNVNVIVDNDSYDTELKVIELYRNYQLRVALEKAIADPLEKEGIDSVAFTEEPSKEFIPIKKDERRYFKAPTQEEELISSSIDDVALQIVSVSFREDNKWRFSDGSSSFYASVLDENFLERVRMSEESFSSGEILQVSLSRKQWITRGTIRTENEVIKVINHRPADVQLSLIFRDETGSES